jgi:hypothetical protein
VAVGTACRQSVTLDADEFAASGGVLPGVDGRASCAGTAPPPPAPNVPRGVAAPPFDWIGIIGTGQSLSVGYSGRPVLSQSVSYGNLKLVDNGPQPRFETTKFLDVGPLVEPIRPLNGDNDATHAYPNNIAGETPHWAMASQMTVLAKAMGLPDLVSFHTVAGESGSPMSGVEKNSASRPYERSLYETRAAMEIAKARKLRFGVGGVALTHGEADATSPTYEAELVRLATDYAADVRAITGQTQPVPMFVSQQHSFPTRGAAALRSTSTLATWLASTKRPDLLTCVGPKYQYDYIDAVHLRPAATRRLGIKIAQAWAQQILAGKRFRPLEPVAVAREGNVVRVSFFVPVPPLVWDEILPRPHAEQNHPWAAGKGFELEDTKGPLRISGVRIAGDTVEITSAEAPRGPLVVRYAMTQDTVGDPGPRAGEGDGRMGLLRDSDPFVGVDDEVLTVQFDSGSDSISGDFTRHTRYDLVVGQGLPPGTAIRERVEDSNGTVVLLSTTWTGPSCKGQVRIHSNQANYAVAFELPVP